MDKTVKHFASHFVASFSSIIVVSAALTLPQNVNTQTFGTLYSPSLSCTRASLYYGDAVLPACTENKSADLDSFTYYESAECVNCSTDTLIEITPLRLNIGQSNGPCNSPVSWNFTGAVYGSGASAYIGGTLSAQSSSAFARINSSIDCNGVRGDSGPNGETLPC